MYDAGDIDWWREAVLYHVYPRSFQDSDGNGVGDLRGLLSRLDYLNDGTPRSLGIDAIWLSPCFPSPMRDFGYDVSDYCDIDPLFGDLPTFDALVAACHARGVRVLVDFVLNHTSEEHPWFLESRSSRSARKRDWYIWRDADADGGPPDGMQAIFGGSAWAWDVTSGQYYLHSFLAAQPDLNWDHPEVVAAMSDVLRFWVRRGVDGFRFDAASKLAKHLGRPRAAAPQDAAGDASQSLAGSGKVNPAVAPYVRQLRRVLDEFPGCIGLAEAYAPPQQLATLYGGPDLDGVHLAFNFQFIRVTSKSPAAPWEAAHIGSLLTDTDTGLPPGALACYALSNHDVPRLRSRYDADGRGEARARAAALLQLGIRGVPCIYNGDELGMADSSVPADAQLNPAGRDGSRAPLPWDDSPQRGFTTGRPWLPVDAVAADVATQLADATSVLSLYRAAVWARREEPSLRSGTERVLYKDDDVLLVHRGSDNGRPVLVILNTADHAREIELPDEFAHILLASVSGTAIRYESELNTLQLPALGAAWVVP